MSSVLLRVMAVLSLVGALDLTSRAAFAQSYPAYPDYYLLDCSRSKQPYCDGACTGALICAPLSGSDTNCSCQIKM
jgi:hypothetical protein